MGVITPVLINDCSEYWHQRILDSYGANLYVALVRASDWIKIQKSENNGVTWSEIATRRCDGGVDAIFLCMKIDSTGVIHLAWRKKSGSRVVQYVTYDIVADAWGSEEIANSSNPGASTNVSLVLDSNDIPHVGNGGAIDAWHSSNRIGGSWSAPVGHGDEDRNHGFGCFLSNGDLVYIVTERWYGDQRDAWEAKLTAAGVWADIEWIDDLEADIINSITFQNKTSGDDEIHWLYTYSNAAKYIYRSAAGVYSSKVTVVELADFAGANNLWASDIYVDENGKVYALYRVQNAMGFNKHSIGFSTSTDHGATWSANTWLFTADITKGAGGAERHCVFPKSVTGLGLVVIGDDKKAYYCATDNFEFVKTYGPWMKRLSSGIGVDNYVV